ncbi:MAG: HD domain-containing protein [Muribaculaceae bacterium]|nr:HD domain-containing protein [Muribaculaceae bacterium]
MSDYNRIIDKYYPEGSPLRDIYLRHCRQVADKALAIAEARGLTLPPAEIEAAAMLHDIGIFLCDAPSIGCHGQEHYLRHGMLGADLLRREGAPEALARVAERHTGSGITREEIIADMLPLPTDRCLMPETTLERLICYADKFYSKSGDMAEKPLPKVMVSMARFGPEPFARFNDLHREFGLK